MVTYEIVMANLAVGQLKAQHHLIGERCLKCKGGSGAPKGKPTGDGLFVHMSGLGLPDLEHVLPVHGLRGVRGGVTWRVFFVKTPIDARFLFGGACMSPEVSVCVLSISD